MQKLAFISQAGSVMKSSLAQAFAVEAIKGGDLSVNVADIDHEHLSMIEWMQARKSYGFEPFFDVLHPPDAATAVKLDKPCDYMIFDCPSRATKATKKIAKHCHLIVQPVLSGSLKDADLAIEIFRQLAAIGIDPKRLAYIITRSTSASEVTDTKTYLCQEKIGGQPIHVFKTAIPDKRGYRIAIAEGHAVTETSYLGLNQIAKAAVFDIANHLTLLSQ